MRLLRSCNDVSRIGEAMIDGTPLSNKLCNLWLSLGTFEREVLVMVANDLLLLTKAQESLPNNAILCALPQCWQGEHNGANGKASCCGFTNYRGK